MGLIGTHVGYLHFVAGAETVHLLHELGGVVGFLAVKRYNHVAGEDAGSFSRAAVNNFLNKQTVVNSCDVMLFL